jgi:hypothetical protein
MKPDEEEGLKREGFQIETLATFTEAEEIAENFYLYRLTLIDAARNRTAAASSTAAPWAMPFLRYS